MTEIWKHAIPGYGALHLYETITGDAPFPIKVRDAVLASTSLGFHYILTTHASIKLMEHSIRTKGYSSHRTHGWGATRRMINATPTVLGTTALVAGSVLGASAIVDQYSVFEPQNVNEKTSFWQGFAAALSGGFSMGGGVKIR